MACVTQALGLSPEALKMLEEALGKEPVANDEFRALFNDVTDITPVRQVARKTGRVTEVSLYKPGDVIILDDGRKYEVDDAGRWIRI